MPSEGASIKNKYMAYINENKLGLQKFPLTGNPFDSISIFAHPDGVYISFISYTIILNISDLLIIDVTPKRLQI